MSWPTLRDRLKRKTIDQTLWQHDNFPFICCNIPLAPEYGVHHTELAVPTQTVRIALDFLQLGYWNRGMLLQVFSTDGLWSSLWTRGSLWYTYLHHAPFVLPVIFSLFSFVYPGRLFMCNSVVFLGRQRTPYLPVHLVHAPSF